MNRLCIYLTALALCMLAASPAGAVRSSYSYNGGTAQGQLYAGDMRMAGTVNPGRHFNHTYRRYTTMRHTYRNIRDQNYSVQSKCDGGHCQITMKPRTASSSKSAAASKQSKEYSSLNQ